MAAPPTSSPDLPAAESVSDDVKVQQPLTEEPIKLKDPPQAADPPQATVAAATVAAATVAATTASTTPTVTSGELKDPPPSLPPPPEEKDQPIPTFFTTKSCEHYLTAKSFLISGELEAALTSIETSIASILPRVTDEFDISLAPLYYLYGTTLLYSVEESENPEGAMMVNEDAPEEGEGTDTAEDLQIAWENLDLARSILSKCPARVEEQVLDLAQIHMRLGDLQRANGNYANGIADYEVCLGMRTDVFGECHRKVADCYYSLGMTSLMLAAEVKEVEETQKCKDDAVRYYLKCGRVFGGLISEMCGCEIPSISEGDEDKKPKARLKSDPDGDNEHPASLASEALRDIRTTAGKLIPKDAGNKEKVDDLKELLDEIQETIDTSSESVKVLQDVSHMKKEAEQQAEAEDLRSLQKGTTASLLDMAKSAGAPTVTPPAAAASTTTIGFAQSSTNISATVNTNLMVVKKKKKRDPPNDTKSCDTEIGNQEKRPKTDP